MCTAHARHSIRAPHSRRALLQGTVTLSIAHGLRRIAQQTGQGKDHLTIGWSTIYLAPAWTTQTGQMIEDDIARIRKSGISIDYNVFDAAGDTEKQMADIQTMIDAEYDICLLIAGSATDLNKAVEDAHAAGVVVINWDGLVTTDELTAKVFEDQVEWGRMTAGWLAEELEGEGKILMVNGPAGLSLSDQRAEGAREVFDARSNIEIAATAHIEYQEEIARSELATMVADHPDLAGIWCGEGAHASAALTVVRERGTDLLPIAGENYNGFLKQWRDVLDEGFNGYATAQVNWMGLVALQVAIRAVSGEPTPERVELPLPEITNETVDQWADDDLPDAYYPLPHIPSDAEIERMIDEAIDTGE